MFKISNLKGELYKHFASILQNHIIPKMRLTFVDSKIVASILRFLQRCNWSSEIDDKNAPNIRNLCALVKEHAHENVIVEYVEYVRLTDKTTGETVYYEIENELKPTKSGKK